MNDQNPKTCNQQNVYNYLMNQQMNQQAQWNSLQYEQQRLSQLYNQLPNNACTNINFEEQMDIDYQNQIAAYKNECKEKGLPDYAGSDYSGSIERPNKIIFSTDADQYLINEYNRKYYAPKEIKYQKLTRKQKIGLLKCKIMISLGKKLIKFSN